MKKRKSITVEDVQRWLAQGYGQGAGKSFLPFFHVRDVPSRGRSSMVMGLKTGRVHHYLSDLEYACHLLSEYDASVTDIREQFALLPYEKTQKIAEALRVRHPKYPGTRTPVLMTSDLVLTKREEAAVFTVVLCVKPYAEIDPTNPRAHRTMEKLLIEKAYWEERGVSWHLVTEREIPATKVRNLDRLRMNVVAVEMDWINSHMDLFLREFNAAWEKNETLISILSTVAGRVGLRREDCSALFARAVWLRLLDVDINSAPIHHDLPVLRLFIKDAQC